MKVPVPLQVWSGAQLVSLRWSCPKALNNLCLSNNFTWTLHSLSTETNRNSYWICFWTCLLLGIYFSLWNQFARSFALLLLSNWFQCMLSYSNTTVYYGIHEHSECIPVDSGVTNLIHDRHSCVDFTLEVEANVARCVHSSVNKPGVKCNSGLWDIYPLQTLLWR